MPDRVRLHEVLDSGTVAHVGVVHDDHPYVLPVAYARDGDRVLIHGSNASRLFRAAAEGAPLCLTVTLLDALVVARSAFESSMHYRSVMALGSCTVLEDAAKLDALRVLTEHLVPGRWDEVRAPHDKELRATMVLALELDECSLKISDGPPDDPDDDIAGDAWAGVLPLVTSYGSPIEAPDLRDGIAMPTSVRSLLLR